jgi:hypothetical protein
VGPAPVFVTAVLLFRVHDVKANAITSPVQRG